MRRTERSARLPNSVYGVGEEPDPRFSLANERTFLAWIRTALALMAGGIALASLQLGLYPGFRIAASLLLVVLGIVVVAQAWFGWARDERALRQRRPLAAPMLALPLAVGGSLCGVLVLAGMIIGA